MSSLQIFCFLSLAGIGPRRNNFGIPVTDHLTFVSVFFFVFVSASGVGLLLGVLAGETDAIRTACITWEEAFVAGMTYGRTGSLSSAMAMSWRVASTKEPSLPAVAAAADSNPAEAVVLVATPGNVFYSAHLADLFTAAGKVRKATKL